HRALKPCSSKSCSAYAGKLPRLAARSKSAGRTIKGCCWTRNVHYKSFLVTIWPAVRARNGSATVRLCRLFRILPLAGILCAGVTAAQDASFPKSDLTPTGATRAGNEAGTIPAWTGGYKTISPGYVEGATRPDPFAG